MFEFLGRIERNGRRPERIKQQRVGVEVEVLGDIATGTGRAGLGAAEGRT